MRIKRRLKLRVLEQEQLSRTSVTLYLNCSLISSARKDLSCVLIVVGPDCFLTSSAITALSFVLFFPFLMNSESTGNIMQARYNRDKYIPIITRIAFTLYDKYDVPWSIMTSSTESTLMNVDMVTSNNLFLSAFDVSIALLFLPKPIWPLLHSI